MKKSILLTLFIVLAVIPVKYAQPVDALIEKGKEILYSGNVHFDQSEMLKARGMFERALASDEENYLAHYYLAYTDYNLAIYFMQKKEDEQFRKFSKSSERKLKELINENGSDAETVSLLGALYGIQVSMNPGLGASLGSQNIALTSKAFGIAHDNPRVLMQIGVSKFNSPEFAGGSKEKALEYFSESVKVFESQTGDKTDIEWGYLDALAWLGIAQSSLGDFESAITAYKKALDVEPDFAWIKYQLLPKAEEILAASK